MEYEEGKKDVDFKIFREQVREHLQSLHLQKAEVRNCMNNLESHFYRVPKTSHIHFFLESDYIFSLKFKKKKVAIKFYSGRTKSA